MPRHLDSSAPVAATLYGAGAELPLDVVEVRLARTARRQTAAKRLVKYWALAAAGLFIPVAHLVLVPGFLIAGGVAAWLTIRRRSSFAPFDVVCPICRENHTFEPDGEFALPQRLRCPVRDEPLVLKKRVNPADAG